MNHSAKPETERVQIPLGKRWKSTVCCQSHPHRIAEKHAGVGQSSAFFLEISFWQRYNQDGPAKTHTNERLST